MQKNWQTVVLFLYRFFITFAYDMFYLIQAEFFPSQIRSIGLMATASTMRAAVMIVPFLQAWFESNHWSIFATFVLSSAAMILFTVKFPETYGVPPPEMIKELEYEHDDNIATGNEAAFKRPQL